MKEYHKLLENLIKIIFDINISIREYKEHEAKILLIDDSNNKGYNINYQEDCINNLAISDFTLLILSQCSKIEQETARSIFEVGEDWNIELIRLISSVNKLIDEIGYNGLNLRRHVKFSTSYLELGEAIHEAEINGLLNFICNAILNLQTNLKYISEQFQRYSLRPIIAESSTATDEKIKFNGGPALLGFLMKQFIAKGYIDLPFVNGDTSIERLATLCYEKFEMEGELSSLKKYMGGTKNISETKAAKFLIPDFRDIK